MSHPLSENSLFDKGLTLIKQCPVCKTDYVRDRAHVVDTCDDTELIHITCEVCSSSMHILLSGSPVGMSVLGMLTDLTVSDAKRVVKGDFVSEDDVLAFHAMLTHKVDSFWTFLGLRT